MTHPPADPRIHPILGLEQADGDGERGAAGARPEGRGDRVGHVGNESAEELVTFVDYVANGHARHEGHDGNVPEGQLAGDQGEDERQHHKPVHKQS